VVVEMVVTVMEVGLGPIQQQHANRKSVIVRDLVTGRVSIEDVNRNASARCGEQEQGEG
jgi:hypothetical protein